MPSRNVLYHWYGYSGNAPLDGDPAIRPAWMWVNYSKGREAKEIENLANRLNKLQFHNHVVVSGKKQDLQTNFTFIAKLLGLDKWFDINNLDLYDLVRLVAMQKRDLKGYNKYMPANMLSLEGRRHLVNLANRIGAFDNFENWLRVTQSENENFIKKMKVKEVQNLQKKIAVKLGAK